MSAPRKYDQEFRDRAVRMYRDRLAEPGESKLGARRHVGSLLDVNQATLRNWIEDRYTDNRAKVPLLGDIPAIGALFRSESRQKRRTNLMVFLRPVVMRDLETTNRVSLDRYDLIRGMQQSGQPPRSLVMPINESTVLPPPASVEGSTQPLNPPLTNPGTQRPFQRTPNDPPSAPPGAPPASAPGQ